MSLRANLSCSMHSIARTSPSGGSTAVSGDRGAFPARRRRGLLVFPSPARAVVKVLSKLAPLIFKGRPPQPFEPSAPFEPYEPSLPQAPSGIQPARLHFITQKEQAQSLLFSFGIYPRKYFTPASKRGWYLFPQIFFPIFSPRRSVWPILPRTLPSGLVMPSTAQEEPLGLKRLS